MKNLQLMILRKRKLKFRMNSQPNLIVESHSKLWARTVRTELEILRKIGRVNIKMIKTRLRIKEQQKSWNHLKMNQQLLRNR